MLKDEYIRALRLESEPSYLRAGYASSHHATQDELESDYLNRTYTGIQLEHLRIPTLKLSEL